LFFDKQAIMLELNDQLRELGQYIPLHYHHVMLADEARMNSFQRAIDATVPPGSVVLELGGGTGVLSFFASKKARKVYCVERNPDLFDFAQKALTQNGRSDTVELVCGDGFEYLPPEPVDVVICEMLHVALIREKQIEMISAFKNRYQSRFDRPLPAFIPEASLLAVQGVTQKYEFNGYFAPIAVFQPPYVDHRMTQVLSEPKVYAAVEYLRPVPQRFEWQGTLQITKTGVLNALRFITKNLLTILPLENRSIDWHNHYLVLPLEEPLAVQAGETVNVQFQYQAGARIPELQQALSVSLQG
jgi:predicted RNA methylase